MTWVEYYEKFYDWANSTQISQISKLKSLALEWFFQLIGSLNCDVGIGKWQNHMTCPYRMSYEE